MNRFNFLFAVLCGIIIGWLTTGYSFGNFWANVVIPEFITAFITSLLLVKNAKTPDFIIHAKMFTFFFIEQNLTTQKMVFSGIFASVVLIILKISYTVFTNLPSFGNNIFFALGLYLVAIVIFSVLGLIFGALGAQTGVFVKYKFLKMIKAR